MKLKILNLNKILYEGCIISLTVPSINGYFQILNNHAPIISVLKKGLIIFIEKKNQKNKIRLKVDEGILKLKKNKIIILL